jgi:hypothetical protein
MKLSQTACSKSVACKAKPSAQTEQLIPVQRACTEPTALESNLARRSRTQLNWRPAGNTAMARLDTISECLLDCGMRFVLVAWHQFEARRMSLAQIKGAAAEAAAELSGGRERDAAATTTARPAGSPRSRGPVPCCAALSFPFPFLCCPLSLAGMPTAASGFALPGHCASDHKSTQSGLAGACRP